MKKIKIFGVLAASLAILSMNVIAKPDIGFVDGTSFTLTAEGDDITFNGIRGTYNFICLLAFAREYTGTSDHPGISADEMKQVLIDQIDLESGSCNEKEARFTRNEFMRELRALLQAYTEARTNGGAC